jgi:RNA polymerase sigma-70 factor (ECF subfamily)
MRGRRLSPSFTFWRKAIDTLQRLRRSDEGALEELLQESWVSLNRYLLTILHSEDRAKDAAQEAFVRLWAGRDRWGPGSARGLLFRLGRNAALDMTRRAKVRERWAREQAGEVPVAPATPEDELQASEFEDRFRLALQELPPRRREVFELVRLRGLTYAEVAAALEVSQQTVANQMTLAHRDLRCLLEDLLVSSPAEGRPRQEERSQDG